MRKDATGAQAVYLNADGLRVFDVTSIPSIVTSNGVDTAVGIFVDVAGNLYLTLRTRAGARHSSPTSRTACRCSTSTSNGLKTDMLTAIVTGGPDTAVDFVVYAASTHDFSGVTVQGCTVSASNVESCTTLTPTTAVAIEGDNGKTGSARGYAVAVGTGYDPDQVSGPAGFLLDSIGIVARSRGRGRRRLRLDHRRLDGHARWFERRRRRHPRRQGLRARHRSAR